MQRSSRRMRRIARDLRTVLLGALLAGSFLVGAAAVGARGDEPATSRRTPAEARGGNLLKQRPPEEPVIYRVRQIVTLGEIPHDAGLVRMWVAVPYDQAQQKLLDFSVEYAGEWQIVDDQDRRGKFLYLEVRKPAAPEIDVPVSFTVRREPTWVSLDPDAAGPLTDGLKQLLAEHLVLAAPHMEVTARIQKIADGVCGQEQNIARQAVQLLSYVANTVDHYSYSKDPQMPTCGIGDAGKCLEQGGGCCTDLNSLFIALARARGIPARLNMGYRLQEKNVEKLVDPGYRCWVEYYVPNFGWIAADVVEADAPGGLGPERWFTGLTARRVWLNQGREFKLAADQAVERVNHMSIAYAEIDGKPARLLPEGKLLKPQISRKVTFSELATPAGKP